MIGFIGCGNLASAVLQGFLQKNILTPSDVAVFVKTEASKDRARENGFFVASSLDELVSMSDTVVLAVKPYVFAELLPSLDARLWEGKRVISFMACYPLARLEQQLKGASVVRIIPTIAVRHCDDCIALASLCEDVSDVEALFSNLGEVYHVTEDMLDRIMIGASSGLGFAAEIMSMYESALEKIGLDKMLAHAVTAKTFANAAKFDDFDDLASKVATKGGVTEKGLFVMREQGMSKTVEEAIITAHNVIK